MKNLFRDSFLSLGAVLGGIAAAITLVLLIVIDIAGLAVNGRNPVQATVFSTVLSFVFLGAVAAMWRGLSQPSEDATPYSHLMGSARFVAIADACLILATIFIPDDVGQSWGVINFALSYVFAATTIVLLIRRLFWMDTLLHLRRTSYTKLVRQVMFSLIGVLIFTGLVWPDSSAFQLIAVALTGTLVFFLFGKISGVSWIVSLSRSQKWKGFGLACLATSTGWGLFIIVIGHQPVMDALNALVPGVGYVVALVTMCSTMVFGRLAFSLLLTLPSADIIDKQMSEKNSLTIMGSILTSVEDLDELLGKVLAVVTGVTAHSLAWIELAADDEGNPVVARGNLQHTQYEIIASQPALGALAASVQQPVYIEHLTERYDLQKMYADTSGFLKSLIIVPIELDNKRIGTLYVGHPSAFAFERESLMLFSSIAATTSLAVQNHRLFDRLLRRERYESELFLAREIQKKLLPQDYAVPDGFEVAGYTSPAFEVGGDYYDVVYLKNKRCCLLIGDVSGKGMSAAMYTAELKGVVLAAASESDSPAELLCRINRAMYGSLGRQVFITLSAMEIDSSRAMVRLARAGHNPFLIRSRRSGTMFVAPKGIGVGLVGSAMFDKALEMTEIALEPGDVCVMYTDGINEAINTQQDEYGNERLEAMLADMPQGNPAELILGAIVRDTAEFGGGAPQHDDMTLLVIHRTAEAVPHAQREEKEADVIAL